jgi:hypothetical protein
MVNKQKIYIAGPYSKGDTILNIRYALEIASQLLDYGYTPFVPHLTGIWHMLFPQEYEKWMAYDFEWIKSCDALLRLDGESYGADREVELAISLDIPVFFGTTEMNKYFMQENK